MRRVELARETAPDVALLDEKMPGGALAATGILAVSPDTKILALSAYSDRGSVLDMLRAGAVGYLVKGTSPREILEAIRRAVRNQASLSADVTAAVINALFQDIDEGRQSEDVLRRSEDKFRGLLESAPDAEHRCGYMGLPAMRERARLAGGRIHIRSAA